MISRSFAVVGPGGFGNLIIAELLQLKTVGTVSSVTVVSRSDAKASHPEWVAQGAKFAIIDYNDRSALLEAFKGVEVVISTVKGSPEAIQSQKALADAAQAVGIEVFVPSEFGGVATGRNAALKIKILDYLKEIGLPYVVFYTGAWADLTFGPLPGLNYVDGKVTVPGIGDTPISFTGKADIVRYVGFIFTDLSVEKLKWKVFRLEGERTTSNEILRSYQKKTGKPLEIGCIPLSELEKRSDTASRIALLRERGEGLVGDPLDNDLYPGWNPKKVLEYLL